MTETLLLDTKEVTALIGVSRSCWLSMTASGKTPAPVRMGRRKPMWRREEIQEWINAGCPTREKWEARRRPA